MEKISGVRTWIEVDKNALKHNYDVFRGLIKPECKLMAVSKSNAYGHDLVQYSQTIEDFGADWIGVDSIVEAETLREEGITVPILVLGYTLPEKFQVAADLDISITVSNFESLEALKIENCKLKIHLKVDTGMHRQGFLPDQINELITQLQNCKNIEIEGVYTHFAAAKNPENPVETEKQVEIFDQVCDKFTKAGFNFDKHASASAGAILFPEYHYDMVRVGIGLYGIWPSTEAKEFAEEKFTLKPALTWKSIVSEVKNIPAGEGISYDLTEILDRDSVIGVIPIGYWHGFRRCLSGKGHVLVSGRRAKVLGRVCMDMIVVDLTDIPGVKAGDEAVLIGKDGDEEITAEAVTVLYSGANVYETLTTINPLIKRIYI